MANGSDDRRRAARLLIRVEDGAFASRLLAAGSSPGVRARVLGVLRWRRAIDHVLKAWSKRPLDRLDPEILVVLRLGLFDIRWLGVPAPVATDAAVRLARRLGKSSAAGLVNAVLRRAASSSRPDSGPPDLEWSHPAWLWQRWRDAFGAEAAASAMAAAQRPAPPWVWFADAAQRNGLARSGTVLEAHPWCPETWTVAGEPPAVMDQVAAGRVFVQDPSSQLVARLAVAAGSGRGRAVDLCAAPGGKTALLDSLGSWQPLVAADLSPTKAVRLGRRVDTPLIVACDAARPPFVRQRWDLVLLDAPCSGTGTFRRHPELKWRLAPDAIAAAADRQRPLVAAAIGLLAAGGVLVYATCSLEPEENEALLDELPDHMEVLDLTEHLPPGLPWIATVAGGVRILPHEWGDGFTIHALRRLDRAPDSGNR